MRGCHVQHSKPKCDSTGPFHVWWGFPQSLLFCCSSSSYQYAIALQIFRQSKSVANLCILYPESSDYNLPRTASTEIKMSAKCCHWIAIEGVRSVARKVIIATALETRSKLFEWLQAPQHFPILVHPPNSNVKFFRIKVTNNVNGRQHLIKGSGNFVRTHSWCGWHLKEM